MVADNFDQSPTQVSNQSIESSVDNAEQPLISQKTNSQNLSKRILILLFTVFVSVIIAFFSYYFYTKHSQNSINQLNNPTLRLKPTGISTNILNVNFSQRKLIATVSASVTIEFWDGNYAFYRVGKIVGGKYQGGDLVDVDTNVGGGRCKSDACSQDNIDRYIKLDNTIVFLPRISQDKVNGGPDSYLPPVSMMSQALFNKTGIPEIIDNASTIPVLEYPTHLSEVNPAMTLDYGDSEQDGTLDATLLMPVFTDPILGKIYTTKPGLSPQGSFYAGIVTKNSMEIPSSGGIGYCHNTACYTNNAFFVFRPDGTYLLYTYAPPFFKTENRSSLFDSSKINWNTGVVVSSNYSTKSAGDCAEETFDEIGVIDPSKISAADLIQLGTVKNSGDAIYGLKDLNNPLIVNFYNNYMDETTANKPYVIDYPTPQTYSSFSSQYPILIWKDPLGRYIRLSNQNLIPPSECEPIIYLYPQKTENVSIKFGDIVHLTSTLPEYNMGWIVSASPNGNIVNLDDTISYPYLFWEGYSTFYPKRDDGFVVKANEVKGLFEQVLPKLGLNIKEAGDFMHAWLSSFNSSPYYFITFYQTETLNQLVPLEITPRPDTFIRIMMEYKPLQKPTVVQPFTFSQVPSRKGLTVVEWGSLRQ